MKKRKMKNKTIVMGIDLAALSALCAQYDSEFGDYPEHRYEGEALLSFFEELKDKVEEEEEEKTENKNGKK